MSRSIHATSICRRNASARLLAAAIIFLLASGATRAQAQEIDTGGRQKHSKASAHANHNSGSAGHHGKKGGSGGDPLWTGLGGNPNWSTAGNWSPGAPTSGTLTDLVFAGSTNTGTAGTPLNNNIGGVGVTMTLNSIAFSSGGGTFFLGGNTLRLDGTGPSPNSITQNSSSAESIANRIDPTAKTNNDTTTVTLGGNGTGVVTLSGVISTGDGHRDYAITKTGTSTFVLSGANTYTGGTTVSGGTLFVNNSTGSGTGTGTVTVNTTGTLGGSGTITGAVTASGSGAKINPGATAGAIGTLNTGALTMNTSSVFSVDMTSTTADQINVTGLISLSTAILQLNIPNGTTFTTGQQFTLLNNDSNDLISGAFSNAPSGTDLIGGYFWNVSYTGGTGNDFVLTAAIPEPSTWFAGGLALASLIYTQRRRMRSAIRRSPRA
jgi:fibronectin-binding autotransporter adhesin